MPETAPTTPHIVTQIAERIKGGAHVDVVFGEARTIGERTIIPVATVSYGFGGGSGGGIGHASDGERTTGGGGGGGVRVQPVGAFEISEDGTRMVPVIDWGAIITRSITLFGLWMLIRTLRSKRR